jgi:hypothetical protein
MDQTASPDQGFYGVSQNAVKTQIWIAALNGVTLDSNIPFLWWQRYLPGNTCFGYLCGFFDTFGGGNDSAYLDNYSVTLVNTPEPSTALPLALLLGIGFALRYKFAA